MSAVIPDPSSLEFLVWGNLVAEQLATYGVDAPTSEELWREWACSLLYVPQLADVPDPTAFGSWREWGTRLLETPLG